MEELIKHLKNLFMLQIDAERAVEKVLLEFKNGGEDVPASEPEHEKIDDDAEEAPKKRKYTRRATEKKEAPEKIKKVWHKKSGLTECVVCGRTKYYHKRAGMCQGCYTPVREEAIIKGLEPKGLLGKNSSQIRLMMGTLTRDFYCNHCETEFKSNKPKLDAVCPNCGSTHVGLAE